MAPKRSAFSWSTSRGSPASPTQRNRRGASSPTTRIVSVDAFSACAALGVHVMATGWIPPPFTSPVVGSTANARFPSGTDHSNRAASFPGLLTTTTSCTGRVPIIRRKSEHPFRGVELERHGHHVRDDVERVRRGSVGVDDVGDRSAEGPDLRRTHLRREIRRLAGGITCSTGPPAESARSSPSPPPVAASSSTRACTAASVPLVTAKYLTFSLWTEICPKSNVAGPHESLAVSFGMSTRPHARRSSAVVGCVLNLVAPPNTTRSSASTDCCGRFFGRTYAWSFAASAGSNHRGSSARGSFGP